MVVGAKETGLPVSRPPVVAGLSVSGTAVAIVGTRVAIECCLGTAAGSRGRVVGAALEGYRAGPILLGPFMCAALHKSSQSCTHILAHHRLRLQHDTRMHMLWHMSKAFPIGPFGVVRQHAFSSVRQLL